MYLLILICGLLWHPSLSVDVLPGTPTSLEEGSCFIGAQDCTFDTATERFRIFDKTNCRCDSFANAYLVASLKHRQQSFDLETVEEGLKKHKFHLTAIIINLFTTLPSPITLDFDQVEFTTDAATESINVQITVTTLEQGFMDAVENPAVSDSFINALLFQLSASCGISLKSVSPISEETHWGRLVHYLEQYTTFSPEYIELSGKDLTSKNPTEREKIENCYIVLPETRKDQKGMFNILSCWFRSLF